MNYSLCQIYDGYQAWFSTDVEETVGEDWRRNPNSASPPYPWDPTIGRRQYRLLSVCFSGLDLIKPQSTLSVFQLNEGKGPWVKLWNSTEELYAGTPLHEFCLFVKRHKGQLFIPASHLEIFKPIIASLELI